MKTTEIDTLPVIKESLTTPSPLPWTVNIHRPHGIIKVESKDGVVCDTINQEANAALIVKAVNLHAKLVGTLEEIVSVCERGREGHAEYTLAVEYARELLKRAKGEAP